MKRAILVIGQSHVAAVRDAAKARREAAPAALRARVIHTLEPQYAPDIEGTRFGRLLEETIREQIDRHDPLVASVIGGNVHNGLSLLRHTRPFDFHLSGENSPPIDNQAEPIAEELVRAALERGLSSDLIRLRALSALVGPFVHVESPPPLFSSEIIAASAERYFADRGLAARTVAPAGLRYRMWRLNARIIRGAVEALGGQYLPVPLAVRDDAGFLRPDYAGDATHGNRAYGEALIEALDRL